MIENSRLVMTQGPQPGQTFVLEQDLIAVGRDPGNNIAIEDPQISRQHARITRQGSLMVIEDLGSTNGTFANGMRLTSPHTLANGDVISLGDAVRLTYYGAGAAVEAGLAKTEIMAGKTAVPQPTYVPPPAGAGLPPAYTPPPAVLQPTPPPVAAGPPPPAYMAAPPADEGKSKTRLWTGCGCLVLALACVALALALWYAPESFWRMVQDFGIPIPTWPF